jgi:hypothetical protein
MNTTSNIPNLERIVFFNGQRLRAGDLAALQRSTRELRWLHNRGLHSWGIGIGFEVKGERGDSVVIVTPGYGLDCLGREILLAEETEKPVPAVAEKTEYYLLASYQSDQDQKVAERRPGVCRPGNTVRLTEEPRLDWVLQKDLPPEGEALALAHATIENCRLSLPLDLSVRRFARPSQGVHIGAGQTIAGSTGWQPLSAAGQVIGILTYVSTLPGRFRTTPRYLAHIAGDRFFAGGAATQPLVALGFTALANATPDGFTLQAFFPRFGPGNPPVNPPDLFDPNKIPDLFNAMRWHVVWMGIEG